MPGREFVLITPLTPPEVADALQRRSELDGATVRPLAALFKGGAISGEGFELQFIGQRNHAEATLRGRIAASDGGSKVAVQIGAKDPFGVLWSAGCVIGALVALLSIRSWAQAPAGLAVAAGAIGLFVSYRILWRKAFDASAATAALALKDVLSAEDAATPSPRA